MKNGIFWCMGRIFHTVRNNFRSGIGKARSGKNRYVVSEKTDVVSVFPMWYRNFSATCLSDTRTEIISNRATMRSEKPFFINFLE
jgi:hypothetical protein